MFGVNDINKNVALKQFQQDFSRSEILSCFKCEKTKSKDDHLYYYINGKAHHSYVVSEKGIFKEYHSYKGLYMSWRLDRDESFDFMDMDDLYVSSLLGNNEKYFKMVLTNNIVEDKKPTLKETKRQRKISNQKAEIERLKNDKEKNISRRNKNPLLRGLRGLHK